MNTRSSVTRASGGARTGQVLTTAEVIEMDRRIRAARRAEYLDQLFRRVVIPVTLAAPNGRRTAYPANNDGANVLYLAPARLRDVTPPENPPHDGAPGARAA